MNEKQYTEIKLTRTNQRPIAFNGCELFSQNTRTHNSTRWQKASIYETDKCKIVVGIGQITCWDGETDHFTAGVFSTKEEAVAHLEEHAPGLAESAAQALDVAERV